MVIGSTPYTGYKYLSGSPNSPVSAMKATRWQRVKIVLDQALTRSPEARGPFLDEVCADDAALREEIESLLACHDESMTFFEEGSAGLLHAVDDDRNHAISPQHIGPYRLLEEIGYGGMGTVYRAARDDDQYDREVALKVIRPGLGSDLSRRFQVERQILARLEHPHIARLYDSGLTTDGRPYFAMEYAPGAPITSYCDQQNLALTARLELFVAVAQAVAYAHRRLVVHRDLKPSNILVTDGGTVKLLDFGIAKLLDDSDAPQTRTGRRLLTPEYAAPEQIRGLPVSTATDVYSLGVLLYELLTGCRPYQLDSHTPAAIEAAVCERDPVKPSTAVTRSGRSQLVPARASRSPQTLRRTLQGDLDTIILKALQKDPDLRYASASAFADDIERHLKGLPIEARRPTLTYRTQKFIRRHRWGAAVTSAFLALLMIYAATLTVQAEQISRERDLAQQAAARSEQVASFLTNLFEQASPAPEKRNENIAAALTLLDTGTEMLDELDDDPDAQAALMHTVGMIYEELGALDRAEPLLRSALTIRRSLHGERHEDVAASLHAYGILRYAQRHDSSTYYLRKAAQLARSLHKGDHPSLAQSLQWWAHSLPPDHPDRDSLFGEALSMLERIHGPESRPVAAALMHFARGHADLEASDQMFRKALSIYTRLEGAESLPAAEVLNDLGLKLEKASPDSSVHLLRKSYRIHQQQLGPDHPETLLIMNNLAAVLHDQGHVAEAEPLYRKVLDQRRRTLPEGSTAIGYTLYRLGRVLLQQGRLDEAEARLREASRIFRQTLSENDNRLLLTRHYLARCLRVNGQPLEAEKILNENHRRFLETYAPQHRYVRDTQEELDLLREVQGRESRQYLLTDSH